MAYRTKINTFSFLFFVIFVQGVGFAKSEEIPRVFFQTYGLMARSVWNSYQNDEKFDLDSFAEDSLAQNFGGVINAMEFAMIVAEMENDPYDLMEKFLTSNDERKMSFALGIVLWLGDRRFHERAISLKSSEISIVRNKRLFSKSPNPADPFAPTSQSDPLSNVETIGDLAKFVAKTLEENNKDGYFLRAKEQWMINAQSFEIELMSKQEESIP